MACEIDCKVRAFTPWPSAYIFIANETVKIADITLNGTGDKYKPGMVVAVDKQGLKIKAQDAIINIGSLQFPGKKMSPVSSILNGRDLSGFVGKVLVGYKDRII